MRDGWKIIKLSEIAKIYNGNSINAKIKEVKYSNIVNGFPFIATKDVSFGSAINYENGVKIPFDEGANFKIAPKDTVLICAEGGSAGRKIGFTNQEVTFGNKLFATATNSEVLNKFVYYYYFTTEFRKHFFLGLAGVIGGVSMKKFKEIEIPFPSPLEQQRIVAILDQVFATIAKAKTNAVKNLKNAKELFESYLSGVFEDNGDEWKNTTLGEILEVSPKNGWSPPAKFQSEMGVSVLTLSAVTGFEFKASSIKHTNADTKEDASYWIQNGDLLITRSNTPKLVGHVAICNNLENKTIYPDLMMKLSPVRSIITTRFLYYQLRSPKLRIIIEESAHGANPTMKKINKQDVQSFSISHPAIKAQQDVVQKLDTFSDETKKMEAIYQQKIDDFDELKKSLLQKAFNGEL